MVPDDSSLKRDNQTRDIIFVSQGHRRIKVELDKVKYVESFKDYINIQSTNGSLRIKENIGAFEKKLNQSFLRVHRSYIINVKFLTGYTKLDIEINEQELPIGSSYREKVLKSLESLSFSRERGL